MEPLHAYWRTLPHLQKPGRAYFVTFCTKRPLVLPPAVRPLVLEACRAVHEKMAVIHSVIVMPDHAHLVVSPMYDSSGDPITLERILQRIKGRSARAINSRLGRSGPVWQAESFDHALRSNESAESKSEYIRLNPVRKGLVKYAAEYPWFWRPE